MDKNQDIHHLARLYATKAKELFPEDPIGFCNRMAQAQHHAWTQAGKQLHTHKPTHNGNICTECGGLMVQSGACHTCTNCGGTSGCG